jgi:CheY-like chemotaxis protein
MKKFAGQHVLVVEDEVIVGMDLQMMLEDAGCDVVGPVGSVDQALQLIRTGQCAIDAAVLDINLHGCMSFDVADALSAAEVPFVMVTGYNLRTVPAQHRERPVIRKPYSPDELLSILQDAVASKTALPALSAANGH